VVSAFITRNYLRISAFDLAIPDEIFGYGVLIEPRFHLVADFLSRKSRFFMRLASSDIFPLEMNDLAERYTDVACVHDHWVLIKGVVIDCFREDHDLEISAEARDCRKKGYLLKNSVIKTYKLTYCLRIEACFPDLWNLSDYSHYPMRNFIT
jgi:hypothetical protein